MYQPLADALLDGNRELTKELVERLLSDDISAVEILNKTLLPTIRHAGDLWEEGELFIPELMQSSSALKGALEVLKPLLIQDGSGTRENTIVIGTIKGDIHDIGKTLVAGMLEASGYSVIDLGADVSPDRFIDTARSRKAHLICISALLTTTMVNQRAVVEKRNEMGLNDTVGILVGGAPVTRQWAERIGAEGYAPDAFSAVEEAARVINQLR